MARRETGAQSAQFFIWVLVVLALIWTLVPFWWAISFSVKRPADFFTAKALPFIQFSPTLENWYYEWRAFGDPVGMGHSLWGSMVVATASTALCLVLGSLAAYWFAKLAPKSWSRGSLVLLLGVILLPRLIPPVITALPYSALMRELGLEDTAFALVVAHTTLNLPLAVVVLASLMAELPDEWIDAARVDGSSELGVLQRIVLPPLRAGLVATGAICFALSWNEFPYALMNAQQHTPTITLAVASLLTKDGVEFEFVGSHLVLAMLPPLIVVLLANRYLAMGLSLGLVKGKRP